MTQFYAARSSHSVQGVYNSLICADSDDVEGADHEKVDAATASLPASTGVGTTAATSQGLFLLPY